MNICVFCSSKNDLSPVIFEQAKEFCQKLVQKGHRLVYGGGAVGLMGFMADEVLIKKGEVIGIIPAGHFENEVAHTGLTELIYTVDLMDRKRKMMDISDAFVVLPGGIGTIDEAIEVITWKSIVGFTKPIVFLNSDNYWNPFFDLLNHYQKMNVLYPETLQTFKVANKVDSIFEEFENAK